MGEFGFGTPIYMALVLIGIGQGGDFTWSKYDLAVSFYKSRYSLWNDEMQWGQRIFNICLQA